MAPAHREVVDLLNWRIWVHTFVPTILWYSVLCSLFAKATHHQEQNMWEVRGLGTKALTVTTLNGLPGYSALLGVRLDFGLGRIFLTTVEPRHSARFYTCNS